MSADSIQFESSADESLYYLDRQMESQKFDGDDGYDSKASSPLFELSGTLAAHDSTCTLKYATARSSSQGGNGRNILREKIMRLNRLTSFKMVFTFKIDAKARY